MGISKLNPSAGGIPFGNTAGRPTAATGKLYSNGETARLELYTSAGAWENIVQEVPGVSGISGTYSESANSGTITINGTNFVSGAIASATGTNGVEIQASSTTFNSLVQLTAVFTGLSNANEPYDIKVTNTSNLFGILPDALYINASPVWQTASGSLGTFNELVSVSVSATATDSDSTISYALASGSTLPSGVTLNSSTGVISGTLPDIATDTTYTFTINASDGTNIIPRTFNFTVNPLISMEYLVVGGGGGGGGSEGNTAGDSAGGGGAGAYRTSSSYALQLGTYSVSVGNGGAGGFGDNNGTNGANGESSIFATITSIGGGGGGTADKPGVSGGSGGGSSGDAGDSPGLTLNAAYGNNGAGASGGRGGGGGGGAGAAGSGRNGGAGLSNSITGSSLFYAGGGASNANNNGAGGSGGSGIGGSPSARNGTSNTGSGGCSSYGTTSSGGSGGSGVVIIAYQNSAPAPTISGGLTYDQPTRSGYRVYRFTAGSGTVTF